MSVMSRFPMGAGGKYAQGTDSLAMNSTAYSIDVTGLEFTPKVVFGSILARSNLYTDNHKTTAENAEGTTVKLLASPNGYASNPTYTIGEKSFRITGYAPPGTNNNFSVELTWKAWG